VRLLGIDTDEKGSPCWSSAKNRISELLLNKEVNLEQGPEDRDLYDRKLRYIFLNNQNINLQLVEEGLAVARFSGKNEKYQIEITAAEKIAREKKIGCKWMNYSNSPNI
jgi:micrococcal nuclease